MSSLIIDVQDRQEIESLIYNHAWIQDNNDTEQLAELYLKDGRLHGIGPDRKGRAAIAEFGRKRHTPPDRIARHVCTNVRLTPLGDGRIKGHLYITLYRHVGGDLGPADPCALADAHDVYARDEKGQWKFSERRLELIFESESHKN